MSEREHDIVLFGATGFTGGLTAEYLAGHAPAVESGARLIHACGFDSIPHDMGAWFTVSQLPQDVPLTVRGYVRAGGRPSGGTLESALMAMSRLRQSARVAAQRKRLEQ